MEISLVFPPLIACGSLASLQVEYSIARRISPKFSLSLGCLAPGAPADLAHVWEAGPYAPHVVDDWPQHKGEELQEAEEDEGDEGAADRDALLQRPNRDLGWRRRDSSSPWRQRPQVTRKQSRGGKHAFHCTYHVFMFELHASEGKLSSTAVAQVVLHPILLHDCWEQVHCTA
jgi:hypothetical protein